MGGYRVGDGGVEGEMSGGMYGGRLCGTGLVLKVRHGFERKGWRQKGRLGEATGEVHSERGVAGCKGKMLT